MNGICNGKNALLQEKSRQEIGHVRTVGRRVKGWEGGRKGRNRYNSDSGEEEHVKATARAQGGGGRSSSPLASDVLLHTRSKGTRRPERKNGPRLK